jgi:cell division protein FtsB
MSNCIPPTCGSTYDDSCEAVDCLFNVEALNIDKLFKRTNDLKEIAEQQASKIEALEATIAALETRVAELEGA